MSMSDDHVAQLISNGEDAFITIVNDLNSISATHVRKDKGKRRPEDLQETFVALGLLLEKLMEDEDVG